MEFENLHTGRRKKPRISFHPGKHPDTCVFLSADKRHAEAYGSGSEITARVSLKNPLQLEITNGGFNRTEKIQNRDIPVSPHGITEAGIETLKQAGHDGIVVTLGEGEHHLPWPKPVLNPFEVLVFDKTQVTILQEKPNT